MKEIKFIHTIFKTHRCVKKGGYVGGKSKAISMDDIVDSLEQLVKAHQALGNKREADQYLKAVTSLRHSGITRVTKGEELLHLPYVGKGIVGKVNELLQTGKIQLLEEFKKNKVVKAACLLNQMFGVGPANARKWIGMGIFTIPDLRKAVKARKVKLTTSQTMGLKYYDDLLKKIPRKESEFIRSLVAQRMKTLFGKMGKTCALLAGSYRTGKKMSGDIDLILGIKSLPTLDAVQKKPILATLVQDLYDHGLIIDTLLGPKIPREDQVTYIGVWKLPKKVQKFKPHIARHIDLHAVGWDEIPFHMLYFGSGVTFSRAIRQRANDLGLKLTDRGLYKMGSGRKVPAKTEKDVFRILKIKWVPPDKRRQSPIVVLSE
jgi:DNA polymerase/3'-5' exonuclease PolX